MLLKLVTLGCVSTASGYSRTLGLDTILVLSLLSALRFIRDPNISYRLPILYWPLIHPFGSTSDIRRMSDFDRHVSACCRTGAPHSILAIDRLSPQCCRLSTALPSFQTRIQQSQSIDGRSQWGGICRIAHRCSSPRIRRLGSIDISS